VFDHCGADRRAIFESPGLLPTVGRRDRRQLSHVAATVPTLRVLRYVRLRRIHLAPSAAIYLLRPEPLQEVDAWLAPSVVSGPLTSMPSNAILES